MLWRQPASRAQHLMLTSEPKGPGGFEAARAVPGLGSLCVLLHNDHSPKYSLHAGVWADLAV